MAAAHRTVVDKITENAFEATTTLPRPLDDLQSRLTAEIRGVENSLEGLRGEIAAERSRLSSILLEQQKKFAADQEARASQFNEAQNRHRRMLDSALQENRAQLATSQEGRSQEFSKAQSEARGQLSTLLSDYASRLASLNADFARTGQVHVAEAATKLEALNQDCVQKAREILTAIDSHRKDVEKLVDVIGNLSVTSGYEKAANSARRSLWLWQSVAVAALILVVAFAYKAFLPALDSELTSPKLASRVILTITVGVLAAYARSQADKFFGLEQSSRRRALELAAIDPYIALPPPEEQHRFNILIGERSFGTSGNMSSGGDAKSPATAFDVLLGSKELPQILSLFGDALKKVPKV